MFLVQQTAVLIMQTWRDIQYRNVKYENKDIHKNDCIAYIHWNVHGSNTGLSVKKNDGMQN